MALVGPQQTPAKRNRPDNLAPPAVEGKDALLLWVVPCYRGSVSAKVLVAAADKASAAKEGKDAIDGKEIRRLDDEVEGMDDGELSAADEWAAGAAVPVCASFLAPQTLVTYDESKVDYEPPDGVQLTEARKQSLWLACSRAQWDGAVRWTLFQMDGRNTDANVVQSFRTMLLAEMKDDWWGNYRQKCIKILPRFAERPNTANREALQAAVKGAMATDAWEGWETVGAERMVGRVAAQGLGRGQV